ncbi:MAG: pitrilysin family protein [Polyangiaceae bacterium]
MRGSWGSRRSRLRRGFRGPARDRRHTCENGLTVLVVENHAVPLVTVQVAVKNRSMTESPEYNGLSHLYEHMFFKANKAIPSQEAYLARAREELGMSWNRTTNTERVNYFFTTTSDHLNDAMVFMRDAIVSPLFDEKELAREREVVVGEIDRNLSNPGYHFWHDVQEKVFWKYPSYKNPLGSAKTVRAATRAKMKTIQERYYVPNNSVLVVTGDVKAKDIFEHADKLYTGWKKAADPFVKYPLVKHPAIKKSEVVLVEQKVGTVQGQIVWHGPSTVGKDVDLTYAADLLGLAISEPSSKFQKALVDSGACTSAGMSWYTQMNTGPITVSFDASEAKADTCLKAVLAELPKIKEADYLSDEEMKNAAHALEVSQAREREKPSSYASSITFWWTSAGLDYYKGYVDNVKKVTRADIARYMDTFVLGKPYVLGVMVSPDMVKKGLSKQHFESIAGIDGAKGGK